MIGFRVFVICNDGHGSHEVVGLDETKGCVVAVEALQCRGIGIDNGTCLLVFTLLGEGQCHAHVALATALGVAMLSVARHDGIGTSHLVVGLCLQYVGEKRKEKQAEGEQ